MTQNLCDFVQNLVNLIQVHINILKDWRKIKMIFFMSFTEGLLLYSQLHCQYDSISNLDAGGRTWQSSMKTILSQSVLSQSCTSVIYI